MRIIIIEDEPLSAEDLAETLVQVEPGVSVTRTLHSVEEAVDYLRSESGFDLIFSDIQLGDGLSFDIFRTVRPRQPVVFCTAFDAYAIEAFKNNGIDYILKPFDEASVRGALDRYRQWSRHFTPAVAPAAAPAVAPPAGAPQVDYDRLTELLRTRPGAVLVYQRDKIIPVRLEDAAVFFIDLEMTRVLCFDGMSYVVGQTLDQLERVGGKAFFRANRQYLVNRKAVRGAAQHFPRKYLLDLHVAFAGEIIVSKTRGAALLEWLTQ